MWGVHMKVIVQHLQCKKKKKKKHTHKNRYSCKKRCQTTKLIWRIDIPVNKTISNTHFMSYLKRKQKSYDRLDAN